MWLTKDNVLIGLGTGLYLLGAISLLMMNTDIAEHRSEALPQLSQPAQINPF